MGVAALAYSSLALIHDVLKANNILADISFLGSSRNTKGTLYLKGNSITFDNLYGFDFFEWKSIIKLLVYPWKYHTHKLLNFDFVFDIAEGDSFTDIYGDKRFQKILNSKRFFLILGHKQNLLPQTIGPFTKAEHEKRAFKVMNRMDAVISRDKQSFDYCSQFLPLNKIFETIDVAFYLPFERRSFEDKKINVGINVSGLLWNGGYTRNNQFNLKIDYQRLMRSSIKYFLNFNNVQIHLLSHVVPENNTVEDDFSVSEKLRDEFKSLKIAPRFDDPSTAKSYISALDFFIGARMHACIAAFSSGVPVFPIAYSRKFNGLFLGTLHYDWLGDGVSHTNEIIMSKLMQAFENRLLLKDQIRIANNTIVKERLDKLKSIISNILNDDR